MKKDIEAIYGLSPLQQGLLFHSLYAPNTGAYVEQLHCRLTGSLNYQALEQALQQVLNRHAILRTAFVWEQLDKPVQVVHKQISLPIEYINWQAFSTAAQSDALQQLLASDQQSDFDLTKAPLMRLRIIKTAADSHYFIWTHHHILLDGWSVSVVLGELFSLYASYSQGQALSLNPTKPYRTYINRLKSQDVQAAEQFWRNYLKGFISPTPLINTLPAPQAASATGYAEAQIELDSATTTALQDLVRQHQLTLNTVIQAAWALLLSRYSNEQDLVFGATVAGRPADLLGIETMVGLFINTLPIRVTIDPSQGLIDWLQALQTNQLQLRQFEYSALADIQRLSEVPRGTSLFDSLLVFENYPLDATLQGWDGGLQFHDIHAVEHTNYPLTLLVLPKSQLNLRLSYACQQFSAETIEAMLGHLRHLLSGLSSHGNQAIGALNLLSAPEQQQLLYGWNETQQPAFLPEQSLHSLFEQQAKRTPEAIAVRFADQHLTYRQLDHRTNQLAHYLHVAGVGADSLVGVCLERSFDLVISLLAILKAGAAYVPLDPSYPAERVQYMLNDAQPSILLTHQPIADRLPTHHAQTICLDHGLIATTIAHQPITACPSHHGGDHLAYMIYTSGSTGQPKGAMNTHRAIVNRLLWMQAAYPLTAHDRVLQKTPFSFDVSVWEFFWPLITGAALVIAKPEGHKDPQYLVELIQHQQITTVHFVPSMLQVFVQAEDVAACTSLRHIVCSGEALPAEVVHRCYQHLPHAAMHNLYGPTEAAVDVTFWECPADQLLERVPIGAPIANITMYVLDQQLQPVPIGIAGDLYIAGVGLARGYHGRAGLTAERFIPNPHGAAGSRMYRTGDVARYDAAGQIDYLGRSDHQVKIRGFRIELGEIEAQLNRLANVRESLVVDHTNAHGEKQLVAYIVPDQAPISPTLLRAALQAQLPEHMLPSLWVELEHMPLSPNGKVDRRQLPQPEQTLQRSQALVAPRTLNEELLAAIWANVLGISQIGIHDNFFELGGDSIRSIQVRSQALKAGLNLSIEQLFRAPTIEQLARLVNHDQAQTMPVATEPFSLISAADRQALSTEIEDAYPLSTLQAGMLFHSQWNPDSATYHDVFSAHLELPFDQACFEHAISQLSQQHALLRTAFDLIHYSTPLQLVYRNAQVPVEIIDLRTQTDDQQIATLAAWQTHEKQQAFDWSIAPLVRIIIHRRSNERLQFSLSFHHAALDGWSVASMLTELFGLYLGLINQQPVAITQPQSVYRDFIALEQQALANQTIKQYWLDQIADSTITSLPRWHTKANDELTLDSTLVHVPISDQTAQGLGTIARSLGIPIKSVLFAAHVRAIALLTGQREIITGMVTNGRLETEDGERVLGLFLNTLPMRMRLAETSWNELAKTAFEAERSALAFRHYPLAEIQRQHGGQQLFDTLFNYTNFHVYQALEGQVKLLGGDFFEQTNFGLTANFTADAAASSIRLSLRYDNALINAQQIEHIKGYYSAILTAMANQPQAHYVADCFLSAAEQAQLQHWNATSQPALLTDLGIQALFAQQAERTPEAIALSLDDQQLSYRELDQRSNQLANYLQSQQIGAEALVGVCLERSFDLLISLLAILKAGAAYVPLDPSYPAERLHFMLSDAKVAIVLTHDKFLAKLPDSGSRVIVLDDQASQTMLSQQAERDYPSSLGGDRLAYMIYTSGSTGQPKGVMNSHRAVLNRLNWGQQVYHLTAHDRVLQKTPFSFDVSVWELFWPLLSGAQLVLARPEGHKDPQYLLTAIQQQQITTIHFVPSMLQAFLQLPSIEQCMSVRQVFCSGEALPAESANRLLARLPNIQLHNLYGPTEAAIEVTHWTAPKQQTIERVPIGTPIANIAMYVLDQHLQPVPIAVAGDLYIAGVGLARGYHGRADLTAERFIPDPYGAAGSRMYRTGDVARYDAAGQIEYLGRSDQQVKIRGFRIELGEIEAALCQHLLINDAVVVVDQTPLDDGTPSQRLIAYVIADEATWPSHGELRTSLSQTLPEHMLPNIVIPMSAFPLTASGKLDRRALPKPTPIVADVEYRAPRNDYETKVAAIWSHVLGLPQISIDSSFFELGGHSLLATQVVSRINHDFEVGLSLRQFFTTPTIAGLASFLAQSQQQQAPAPQPTIPTTPRNQAIPLSFAQQRLWFFDQLEPNTAHYTIPVAVRLQGSLNLAVLEQSLSEMIRRHEILRTILPTIDGQATQQILPAQAWQVATVDLRQLDQTEQADQAQKLAKQLLQQPFDLANGPLLRTQLLRLSSLEHIFLVSLHHSITDGWSMGIFIDELTTLYGAFLRGQASPLAELPIQYADFAVWQRNWLQGSLVEQQLNYWKKQLAGISALDLPTDHMRQAFQTFNGAEQRFSLDSTLSTSLRQLSQQAGSTLFMTLLAAFQTLLFRYTNQTDIAVGSPIANRTSPELEHLIGFFANTLVFRSNLAGNPSFSQLLQQVREVALEAYAHQDIPFEQLVDAIQPERNLSRQALFQVMFVLQNMPARGLEFGDLQLSPVAQSQTTANFDLTLTMQDSPEGLIGVLNYNCELFEASTIERMIGHFTQLLRQFSHTPTKKVGEFSMLDVATRQQVLDEWNATHEPRFLPEQSLHSLFEQQAKRTPEAIAVRFADQHLTYRQLDHRTNQLAHYLHVSGVGADSLVGVCLERSFDLVISLLAILKAGAAYVPLDPSYPAERVQYMLNDAHPSILLTHQPIADRLPTHHAQTICLDHGLIATTIAHQPITACPSHHGGDHLAYMIYTSGSTGQPKGAMNTHRAIINRLLWMQAAYPLTAHDRVLQKTPFSFDVSVWEFFWPLISGAELVIAKPEGHKDPQYLVELIQHQQITTVHFVPSMLQVFVQAEDVAACTSLRHIVCSGEALPAEVVHRCYQHLPHTAMHNLYGPTEAAVDVTFWECPADQLLERVLIGVPIANIAMYILDGQLQPVPIGIAGDLYIAGVGLARGYHGRAGLTAERFIPNPHGAPGSRMYRTGDVARYDAAGQIDYLGRSDHQVKIRGFRIELGEIEAQLNRLANVRESLVVDHTNVHGEKQLVAYIVPDQAPISPSLLRAALQAQLPEHMLPSLWVELEHMPLSPNGKVDRRQLPSPQQSLQRSQPMVAPRTPTEATLAGIWTNVLGVPQVGINDNFFELGGDSILAIQMVARANQAGLHLTPKLIFQHQTIADLALVASEQSPIIAEQGPVSGPIGLTPIQHWFFEQNQPEPQHWNLSMLVEVPASIQPAWLEQAINGVIAHHDALRITFVQHDHGIEQINAAQQHSPLSIIDLADLAPHARRAALEAHANRLQASLDLSQGPLFKPIYFDYGAGQAGRLLLIVHHLLVDGLSWRIVVEDIQHAYQLLSMGQNIQLPAKTSSFKQWSEQLQRYASSKTLADEAGYWLNQIPVWHPGLPVDDHAGEQLNTAATSKTLSVELTASETYALLHNVPAVYQTQINEVLLTALTLCITEWTAQTGVLVALEGHGREDIIAEVDLSRTVGWFTSLYPIYLELEPNSELGSALKSIKEQVRQIPERGIGYGILRYLQPDQQLRQHLAALPKAEIGFNYFGQIDQALESTTNFAPAYESAGALHSPQTKRQLLIDVNGLVIDQQLRLNWTYNTQSYQQATIAQLADSYLHTLRQLIEHCQSAEAGGYTPSDFPDAEMSQDDLDGFFARFA